MIDVDDRHWPLVIYRFNGVVTMSELEAYLKRQDEMLSRRELTMALVLTDKVKMWDTPVLKRQAEWVKEHRDILRRYSLGVALVIQSPLVRGMLRAILWMQPMPQPHAVCSTSAEALEWLRGRAAAAHLRVELPAAL